MTHNNKRLLQKMKQPLVVFKYNTVVLFFDNFNKTIQIINSNQICS